MSAPDRAPDQAPDAPRSQDALDRFDHALARFEGFLLVVILSTMVTLAAMQFVLRKSFDFGFEWADLLIRQMVLWLGFVGGTLATYQGQHIAIDAFRRLLAPRRRAAFGAAAGLVASGITALMAGAAYTFVQDERVARSAGVAGVPAWVLASVIPGSLAVMAFHFLVRARHLALVALGRREDPAAEGRDGA